MSKRGNSKKLSPVEGLVVALVCLFILGVVPLACRKARSDAFRIDCGRNLSLLGRAMLIYANDYDGELPRSGGRNSQWTSSIPDWRAANRLVVFGLSPDGSGGQATISSCFYLLVKYNDAPRECFVCPGDAGTTTFSLAGAGVFDKTLIDLWDFGPEPYKHCSYAYHMPFGLYPLTTSSEPNMAVAADRNPWISSPHHEPKEITLFDPDCGREAVKVGNAVAHYDEGQNVLFVDGHVAFENEAFCGIHDDNIYTFWDGGDIRRGSPPGLGSEPQHRMDSLLVHDPAWPEGASARRRPEAPSVVPDRRTESRRPESSQATGRPARIERKPATETRLPATPGKASDPNPPDGSIYASTWVTLMWSPGAPSHNVYLGHSFDDVKEGTGGTFRGNVGSPYLVVGFAGYPYPAGLVPGTTYYWRVDGIENTARGKKIHRGDIWSFTVTPGTSTSRR